MTALVDIIPPSEDDHMSFANMRESEYEKRPPATHETDRTESRGSTTQREPALLQIPEKTELDTQAYATFVQPRGKSPRNSPKRVDLNKLMKSHWRELDWI